ncbi:Rhodanese-related sulfurtransferase [Salinibacillus kushneri]|uniref:Rhodanese-related sulfurtransferase n=2 Tax=Salinibacillus kushneri TaxID=237682 RepID=A0A1I0FTY4_9BACI|nr:Rhodanese-related sulfurtransferase [Salinibacillus kushneri]
MNLSFNIHIIDIDGFSNERGSGMEILFILIVAFLIYTLIKSLLQRRYVKTLPEEEFKQGYRKAQLIDVREPNEFDKGHILGARNIPLSQLKQRLVEIREDKPVYLYCQSSSRSIRAANILRKKGYQDISQLKGGFKKWTGKIKTKK